MKKKYFPFSKSIFARIVWIFMFIIFLIIFIGNFKQIVSDWKSVILLIFYISFLIYSVPFLPLIKIDETGIAAIRLFERRKMRWNEVKNIKFIEANPFSGLHYLETSININNKKKSTTHYIYISKNDEVKEFKSANPTALHFKDITTKTDIAFEYDEDGWNLIQEHI